MDERNPDAQDNLLESVIEVFERHQFSTHGGPVNIDPSVLGNVFEKITDHSLDEDPASGGNEPAMADDSGTTVRSIVAPEFNVIPEAVEGTLRNGNPVDQLNNSVEAIEEAEDVEPRKDYGKIQFINPPKHYCLTKSAVKLYESEENW